MTNLWYSDFTNKRIGRVVIETGADTPELLSVPSAYGVAIDSAFIYWGDWVNGRIGRAKLDGSAANVAFIVAEKVQFPIVTPTHIYWHNTKNGYIARANINGTEVNLEWLNAEMGEDLGALTTDQTYIYWSRPSGKTIGRAKLDGTERNPKWIEGLPSEPRGVFVTATHVYWGYRAVGTLGRAKIAGTEIIKEWVKGITGGGTVGVAAITREGEYLYLGLTDTVSVGNIAKVKIDGTGLIPVWLKKEASINGVATTGATPESPPTNSPLPGHGPTVTGPWGVHERLRAGPGTWETLPGKFTFQWQRFNEETGEWEDIEGATEEEYELTEADEGSEIRVVVTAIAEGSTGVAASSPIGPVEGFVQGALGQPHGFPDWQPWLAKLPTPLYSETGVVLTEKLTIGPLYVGDAEAIDLLLQQTAGEKAFRIELFWHVTPALAEPYMVQQLYLHPKEAELHQQFPSEADHVTIVLEPLTAGGEATQRILVQSTDATVVERRLGNPVLLDAAATKVAKEASTQLTLARTAPGTARLVVAASGEGAGRTVTLEQLNSKGEWVRFLGFPLANASAPTALSLTLPSSPVRVTIGNTTAGEITVDLLLGAS